MLKSLSAMFADAWSSRELAWHLFRRDFAAKYRESFLGYAWALLPSILLAFTMSLAGKAAIINTDTKSIPYTALALVGVVLWQTFSEAMNAPSQAVNQSKLLLTRIKFPHEALIMAKIAEVSLNSLLRFSIILFAVIWWGTGFHWTLALTPVAVAFLILLGIGLGLLAAPVGGIYNDVAQLITFGLGIWMFLTPVIYEKAKPGSLVDGINAVNPVTPLLVTGREWVFGQSPSMLPGFFVVAGLTMVFFVLGWGFWRFAMNFVIERASA